MPSGAASRLASARRNRIWPQRETIGCVVPARTARTSPAGWRASEPAGRPPSCTSSNPTRSIDRRAAGGMSNLGFNPSNSSRSSVDIDSSSSSVGRLVRSRLALGVAPGSGNGWTISPGCWLTVPGSAASPGEACVGVGVGARVARGVGVGAGAGSSKPGGSKSTGASCASTIAELSASAAPPIIHAAFISHRPGDRLLARSGAKAPRRRRSAPQPAG